jgi:ATP-dependent RNA helicase SUPV3L1/SUV3
VPALRADHQGDLAYQERTVRLASAYLWLARRFPDTFDDGAVMRGVRERANAAIERTLRETATLKVTQRIREKTPDRVA